MKISNRISKRTFVIVFICSIIFDFLGLFFYNKNIETINDFITFTYGYVDLWHINNIVNIVYWIVTGKIKLPEKGKDFSPVKNIISLCSLK